MYTRGSTVINLLSNPLTCQSLFSFLQEGVVKSSKFDLDIRVAFELVTKYAGKCSPITGIVEFVHADAMMHYGLRN